MQRSDEEYPAASLEWLGQQWAGALAQVLESMTGARPDVRWSQETAELPSGSDIWWWEQTFSIVPAPALWLGASQETWNQLGASALRAAGIDEVESSEAKSTFQEIVSQSFASFAASLSGHRGEEMTAGQGRELPGPPEHAKFQRVIVRHAEAALPPILVAFSPALVEALDSQPVEHDPTPEDVHRPPEGVASESPKSTLSSKTLDLLLEVELSLTVSFGRAQMPLRDVLKLTAGSIVELNRSINEPVELILNNCVVAVGEVVMVEGNYGVRIQQIMSHEMRLETTGYIPSGGLKAL